MSEDVLIRRATAQDADALSSVGRDTFAETFGDMYRPEDLEAFLTKSHAPAVYERLIADRRHGVWVAETAAGDVAAYAVAGPVGLETDGLAPEGGEITRLYVRAGHQGAGLGTRLLETTLEWLEREGFSPLYLSVYSENEDAQRLYRRYGFSFLREYEYPVGEHRDREFVFVREAAGADMAAE